MNAEDAMNDKTPFTTRDWPTEHEYVGQATLREGNGWLVNVYAFDPQAADRKRLVGTTAAPTLERLEERTWELVHTLDDSPDVRVAAAPVIDEDVMRRVIQAWQAMADAKQAEATAARQIRSVVKELRSMGLSLADIAFLTHVSRGRVSQLLI
ncbi:MAG: hypothetical protein HZY73_12775 [Micropruina sp.]|nr:MAG: hypothetical protein HZY73_12775 [Micropruina sp.]